MNQQLEAAYIFESIHDSSNVSTSKFKDWQTDYYVSIDRDTAAGQIFLGGNYGVFEWVGFENPIDVTANQEIPLLGSVLNGSSWTYADIVNYVGTFTCGVARANGATQDLTGATFTVKLRITNPGNPAEFYDVNTVSYTFK